jgi:hypothetical protein
VPNEDEYAQAVAELRQAEAGLGIMEPAP